jgi:hypothetical protein
MNAAFCTLQKGALQAAKTAPCAVCGRNFSAITARIPD